MLYSCQTTRDQRYQHVLDELIYGQICICLYKRLVTSCTPQADDEQTKYTVVVFWIKDVFGVSFAAVLLVHFLRNSINYFTSSTVVKLEITLVQFYECTNFKITMQANEATYHADFFVRYCHEQQQQLLLKIFPYFIKYFFSIYHSRFTRVKWAKNTKNGIRSNDSICGVVD